MSGETCSSTSRTSTPFDGKLSSTAIWLRFRTTERYPRNGASRTVANRAPSSALTVHWPEKDRRTVPNARFPLKPGPVPV